MISGIDLFRMTGARMRYLAERQNVVAQNIANADTPHYRARDLRPFSFESMLVSTSNAGAPLHMAATNGKHIAPATGMATTVVDQAAGYGDDPSGNTVTLEEQMVKQADVTKAYDMATAVFRHGTNLFRIAIGRS